MNYNNLEKPLLTPPSVVFSIVWTILYILMAISYGRLKIKKLTDAKINFIFFAQIVINLLWPIFFFRLNWLLFAFFWILLLIVFVVLMIIEFYKKDKLAGLLQIPYLLWILFAAYLNLSFYILN